MPNLNQIRSSRPGGSYRIIQPMRGQSIGEHCRPTVRGKASNELGEDPQVDPANIHGHPCSMRQRPTTSSRTVASCVCSGPVDKRLYSMLSFSGDMALTHISWPLPPAQGIPQTRTGPEETVTQNRRLPMDPAATRVLPATLRSGESTAPVTQQLDAS